MNKKRIIIVVLCLAFLFVLRGGAVYYITNATSQALTKIEPTKAAIPPSMQAFAEGYYYSDHFFYTSKGTPQFGQLPLIIDGARIKKSSVTRKDVIQEVKEYLPKNYADFESKLPRTIMAELNMVETSIPDFKIPDIKAVPPRYSEYRSTSRFWADLGRLMLDERKENAALAISAGILLMAHNLDRDPENGALLVGRMIGMSMRNIGNSLLVEHINQTNLSANQIKAWIPKFKTLRKGILPLSDTFKVESTVYEEVAKLLISKGNYAGKLLLSNKKNFEKFYANTMGRLQECDNDTYSKKVAVYREVDTHIGNIYDSLQSKTTFFIKALFTPYQLLTNFFGVLAFPNYDKAYAQEAKTLQLADGALVALIIKAYVAEKNAFPESLQQVEDWYGEKLPGDLFADMAPLQFNKTGNKQLFSVGPDMKPNTDDDLIFMPYK